jgi:hypothetical protein
MICAREISTTTEFRRTLFKENMLILSFYSSFTLSDVGSSTRILRENSHLLRTMERLKAKSDMPLAQHRKQLCAFSLILSPSQELAVVRREYERRAGGDRHSEPESLKSGLTRIESLALSAERDALVQLRKNGEIGDAAFQVIEEHLDWAESSRRSLELMLTHGERSRSQQNACYFGGGTLG